jgi:hypothetical protein
MVLWSRRFLKSHAVKGSISAPKVNCHHHERPTKHTHATNIYAMSLNLFSMPLSAAPGKK